MFIVAVSVVAAVLLAAAVLWALRPHNRRRR